MLTPKAVKDIEAKYQSLHDNTRAKVEEAKKKAEKTYLEVKRSKETWKKRENQLVEHK